MGIEQLPYQSKTKVVEEYLRAKLRTGEIQPGERLRQDLLAEQLGVSSTPVREALRRLEAEGLVVHIPNKGVTALETQQHEIREILPLRALLEGYATRLAVARLSDKDLNLLATLHQRMVELVDSGELDAFSATNDHWHSTIYWAAGSKLLEKTIRGLWKLYPWDDPSHTPGRPPASIVEHERILRALRARDAEEAERAMAEHLRAGERFLLDFVGNRADN